MIESKTLQTEDPNAEIDPVAAIISHDNGLFRGLSVCFPAAVLSYDRERHIAKVQPLVKEGWYREKWRYDYRMPYTVKVRAIQHGGFTIDFPLFVGDTGWVIASDRDTMLLKQQGALTNSVLDNERLEPITRKSYPQKPNSMTLHDLSMGFFIPDNWARWEFKRWKDSTDIDPEKSLCIGQGIDTEDGEPPEDEDADKTVKIDPQQGDRYEKETSSSLVIERHKGIHLLSSSKKEEKKTARITLEGDKIESEVKDEEKKKEAHSFFNFKDGMEILRKTEDGKFTYTYKDGVAKVEVVHKSGKKVTITFAKGGMQIETEGKLNVRTLGHASLNAKEVSVKAKTAMVAAEKAKVLANKDASLEAGKDLDIQSFSDLKVYSGRNLDIIAANDLRMFGSGVTVFGRKKMKLTTKKKIELTSDVTMNSRNLDVGGGVVFKDGDLAISGNQVNIKAPAVSVSADYNFSVSGNISVEGWSKGVAAGTSAWVWSGNDDD